MHVPTADELAAIAGAAYFAVMSPVESAEPETSRWSLAGRLPKLDNDEVRLAARSASRWNVAGRLDG